MFKAVSGALAEAIDIFRPCVRPYDVDTLLLGRKDDLGGNIAHGSGLGLDVTYHADPRIVSYNKCILQQKMMFRFEPGPHFPPRWDCA